MKFPCWHFVVLSALLFVPYSCKSSSSGKKKNNNNTEASTSQPILENNTIVPSTTALIGGIYMQATPCKEGFFADWGQLFGFICIDEVKFIDSNQVQLKMVGVGVTSTYTQNVDVVMISVKDIKRHDGGKSFGGNGTINLTVSPDFRTIVDKKKRILTRQ